MNRNRQQFEKFRRDYLAAQRKSEEIRDACASRYGEFRRNYLNTSQLRKYLAAAAMEERARDGMFALLDRISPRDWRATVACHWVMTELSFEDAVTYGALSVLPTAGYGSTPDQIMRFAVRA